MNLLSTILFALVAANNDIREVEATSCELIPVNLGLGKTTLIVLEQEPETTLYADKKHFRVNSHPSAPRSLSVIPFVDSSEIDLFRDSTGLLPGPKRLAELLNQSFKTNLFVFFKNNNQLMFELRFVEKNKADNVLKVKQVFNEGCTL